MQNPIIGRWLGAAGALTLAALLAACAEPAPPPAPVGYAPPPGGYSGSSTPPEARLQPPAGFGSSQVAAPQRLVVNRLTPMREGPREAFSIRAVLPPGTPVTTDGYVGGDWWQVQSKYGTGWVYSRDLSPS